MTYATATAAARRGIGTWPARRLGAVWIFGILIEAALIGLLALVLRAPTPDVVAKLRGEPMSVMSTAIFVDSAAPRATLESSSQRVETNSLQSLTAITDTFYTVLHWPLSKPLLEGGGHVIAAPMSLWWVPALYVLGVPLLLVGITVFWLMSRRRLRAIRAVHQSKLV